MKYRTDIRNIIILMLFAVLTIFILHACKDDNPVDSGDCPNGRRSAVCNDGTTSSATGSGGCSGHGGVDYWLCN